MKSTNDGRAWVVESGEAACVLSVDAEGHLLQTYWGQRLPDVADYPAPEAPRRYAFGSPLQRAPLAIVTGEQGVFAERTLDVVAESGLRGLALRFGRAEQHGRRLEIMLEDAAQNLEIVLSFEELSTPGLMARGVAIRNRGSSAVTIERALTASFHLPAGGPYALSHLDGRWGDEFRIRRDVLPYGALVRESRRVTTSHGGVPYFAIDRDGLGEAASEEHGAVWFGTLQWSGNWKLIAERTADDRAVVHLGLNDHDFRWKLEPGETFATPRVIFGYTEGGHGAVSRALHDLVRDELAPRRGYVPPVVYNSWYATLFDVDEVGQTALADRAGAMGVELFVMDDGWFAGRRTDGAGLGDWWPDPEKFPNGLRPLADAVHARGMQFGLWIEPEMVNPDSDLYRAHPDWILHFAERDRTLMRNQSILNMARLDVQDYLIEIFDRMLTDTPIDFVKWDMNRNASEPGWPGYGRDQREVWVRYVEGLYRVWGELRRRHPRVIWENCSGGGGRVDMAMMALTEQSWVSDNTVPAARLEIQEGYSRLFPASTMAAWVTDEEKDSYPLDFRFHVSMAGALGVGGNLLEWTAAEQARAAEHIATYKALRPIIAGGDLYRLRSPRESQLSALGYVAKDKSEAVLFVYRLRPGRPADAPVIRPAGLDPDARYEWLGQGVVRSGRGWAQLGLTVPLKDDGSAILRLQRR
jgi:alpha-galactosidase